MERKLREVEDMPADESSELFGLPEINPADDDSD